jgi:thymidylate kinase
MSTDLQNQSAVCFVNSTLNGGLKINNTSYTPFLHDLTERGIGYVLLRDSPEAPELKDLDVLIDRSRRQDFLECGARHGFQLLKARRWNPGKMCLLHWDKSGSHLFDVHELLIYQGVEYLDAKTVLARRRRMGDYFVLSPEDELLHLLFHNVLAKGEIQNKHRKRLEELFRDRLDEEYLFSHLRRYGLDKIFIEARQDFFALAREPAEVEQLRSRTLRRLLFKRGMNLMRRLQVKWSKRLNRLIPLRRGALIVFLGPDGCGKSSLTDALRSEFCRASIRTETIHLSAWGQKALRLHKMVSHFNPKAHRLKDKALYKGQWERSENPGTLQLTRVYIKGLIIYLLLAIECWCCYFVFILPELRRGKIVLADRYVYDILVGYRNRPVHYLHGLRKWICKHYPRPDLTILLDAPPEVIYLRKPEFDVPQLADIRRRYQEVARAFGFQCLDTSVSIDATLDDFRQKFLPVVMQILRP